MYRIGRLQQGRLSALVRARAPLGREPAAVMSLGCSWQEPGTATKAQNHGGCRLFGSLLREGSGGWGNDRLHEGKPPSSIAVWSAALQRSVEGSRTVHVSSPMLKGELAGEEADDADTHGARNARAERGVTKKAPGRRDRRVATTVAEGPAATATYGIIALVAGVFVVALVANLANGYLRPDGQFWLYHRTLRTLKKDEKLLDIMGGSIRGVHSRRTSNSRVNLLQCAQFVDDDGVKRCRLKFYIVPSNTGLDDAGVVFVEYDVSSFFKPTLSYLIVQLIATGEKVTLWENGEEVGTFSSSYRSSVKQ